MVWANQKFNLKNRKALLHNEGGLQCQFCGKTFGRNHHLKVHIRTVHDGFKTYKCEHCEKSFGAESTLKVHILIRINECPCVLCPVTSLKLNHQF